MHHLSALVASTYLRFADLCELCLCEVGHQGPGLLHLRQSHRSHRRHHHGPGEDRTRSLTRIPHSILKMPIDFDTKRLCYNWGVYEDSCCYRKLNGHVGDFQVKHRTLRACSKARLRTRDTSLWLCTRLCFHTRDGTPSILSPRRSRTQRGEDVLHFDRFNQRTIQEKTCQSLVWIRLFY